MKILYLLLVLVFIVDYGLAKEELPKNIDWNNFSDDSGWKYEPAYYEDCPKCKAHSYEHKERIIRIGKEAIIEKCNKCGYVGNDKEFSIWAPERYKQEGWSSTEGLSDKEYHALIKKWKKEGRLK